MQAMFSLRRRWAALIAALALATGACGGDDAGHAVSTASPTTAPSTTTTTSTPTTTPPTTSSLAPSTTTAPPATMKLGPIPDDPGLPAAHDAGELHWHVDAGSVPGWVLFGFVAVRDEPSGEIEPHGLYAMSPEGELFEIGALPGMFGVRVIDVAGDHALMFDEEGGLWLLDILNAEASRLVAPDPDVSLDAAFARNGESVLVTRLWPDERVRLSRLALRIRGEVRVGAEVTLVDHEIAPYDWLEPSSRSRPLAWLELPDNTLVTIDDAGFWIRDGAGLPLRELEEPGLACDVKSIWRETELGTDPPVFQVVVSCTDVSAVGSECWDIFGSAAARGLWLVATDGSPAVELYGPDGSICPDAATAASVIGDVTAMERPACCDCGGGLLFTDGTGTWAWEPAGVRVCDPHVVGVRNGAWLVIDGSTLPVLYEIAPDGTTTALTPTGPGFGGVSNAVVVGG